MNIRLCDIKPNEEYTVDYLNGNDSVCHRLSQLGFSPGSSVKLISKLPFKGPMAFKIRGAKIVLRQMDAACISVA